MKIIIQRVLKSSVEIDKKVVGSCNNGMMLLVGFGKEDSEKSQTEMNKALEKTVQKICKLRIFPDKNGKMNKSILDISGEFLVISQFTLYANLKKGNRPSFLDSQDPKIAEKNFDDFVKKLKIFSNLKVETGKFGCEMRVDISNDGPTTIILET